MATEEHDSFQDVINEIYKQQRFRFRIEACEPDWAIPDCYLSGIKSFTGRLRFVLELSFDDSQDGAKRWERFEKWPHAKGFKEHVSEDGGVSYILDLDDDSDAAKTMLTLVLKDIYGYDQTTPIDYQFTVSDCPFCYAYASCEHLVLTVEEYDNDITGVAFPESKAIQILKPVCWEFLERLNDLDEQSCEEIMDNIQPDRLKTLLDAPCEEYEPGMPLGEFYINFSNLQGYLAELFEDTPGIKDVSQDFDGGMPGTSDSLVSYWAKDADQAANKAMEMLREDAAKIAQLAR